MSTFFWILGILSAAGLTFVVAYFMISDKLCVELTHQQQQLKEERQNFKKSYDEAQQWYSQALRNAKEKETELNVKEKQLQELNVQLDRQITQNNQEKEKLIENYHWHLKNFKASIQRLESQLENARQRSKRFAKQVKNQV